MPSTPTAAQADASRRNGTRHALLAEEFLPSRREEVHLAVLLDDLARRHRPVGEVEAHWVRQIAIAMLRTERLNALELRVLDAALEGA
ncbi:hypothetical protein, partial [Marinimicrococcus flavescens]|nr:hypothetical protein [Marinimicrococcus flavescens]